jgi:hypothetical protein
MEDKQVIMIMNTSKMKPEIKRRWVKALTSGRYRKGRGQLRIPNDNGRGTTYCCLGVLTELFRLEQNRNRKGKLQWSYEAATFCNNRPDLPQEVMDWAGLSDANPTAGDAVLAAHNDGDESRPIKRKPFRTIAKIINDNL